LSNPIVGGGAVLVILGRICVNNLLLRRGAA